MHPAINPGMEDTCDQTAHAERMTIPPDHVIPVAGDHGVQKI